MFERIYGHTLHNPGLFWLVGAPLLVYFGVAARRTGGRLAVFCVCFQLVVLLDTGLLGGLSPLSGGPKTAASIVFVILGDLRFFVLLEAFRRGATWWKPVALSLVVPVLSNAVRPWLPPDTRSLFLVYELMFAGVALAILLFALPRQKLTEPYRKWSRGLAIYEIVQYLGWASADILILNGIDAGFLLRLLPNAMYYAGFLPFAWLTAPSQLRS